jgi:hypothetical protein
MKRPAVPKLDAAPCDDEELSQGDLRANEKGPRLRPFLY